MNMGSPEDLGPDGPEQDQSHADHTRDKWGAMVARQIHALEARLVRGEAASKLLGIIALWLAYVVIVEGIASMVINDKSQILGEGIAHPALREQFQAAENGSSNVAPVAPMARWDSFWFHDIATQGYTGASLEHNAWPMNTAKTGRRLGFLPLYPLAMRIGKEVFSVDLFTAGLWVSRASLLLALVMLMLYGQPAGANEDDGWGPLVATLAFPSAFILVSVYTESLFLAMVLSSFVLTNRGWYRSAAAAAFLAGLTRSNGLALVPALLILGWMKWRQGQRSPWVFVPALGVTAAYGLLAAYYAWEFGDPVAYLTAKREAWETHLCMPWTSLDVGMTRLQQALEAHDLGSMYIYLELPCVFLIIGSTALLIVHRLWAEATFVAASAMMTLVSGTLWGLPRLTILLFPVFVLLGRLHRNHKVLWYLYLLLSVLAQVCVLVNYVNFRNPPP